ncbi:LytR/AlgR family response regulator transcription factor [Clostridium psychrophilum]|uniref:LytR/AlgR family response regulator transcription factor n=1 Tax=Clostridium psychrophilum TaxID=132926 RepID=UPI001C0C931F|nr:LytTR family DNA-binding domain-containing protein [Clostridium psychrophilum]MBU3179997.1 LytTR family DNA-binding domain-containing protein [Clostridium psychrophilum]
MLRVVLVEANKLSLDELSNILSKNNKMNIIGKFLSSSTALEFIKISRPEIVFLNIEMPVIDGFIMAEEICNLDFPVSIVFVTEFDKYAIRAFQMNAIDYVLKPFSEKRLELTMDKINERLNCNKNILQDRRRKEGMVKLPVWKNECIYLVHPQDILYCTVLNKEVFIFTGDDKFTTHDTLTQLEDKLVKRNFFRSHKSYLVNLDRIYKIVPSDNNTFLLQIEGVEEEVPVSRHYVKDFKKIINI